MTRGKKQIMVQLAPGKKSKKNKTQNKEAAKISAVGQLLRLAGSTGGGALGTYLGAPGMGTMAGNQLGAALSKWLGFGDYTVNSNSIVKANNGTIPAMHSTNQSVVVRHKEYIGPVKSSVGFKLQYSLPLNPGMSDTFPWLYDVAHRFQEYTIRGMVFHYVPSSGAAVSGSSPALGNVMIQTTYRTTDEPPENKLELLNEYCASEAPPNESFAHPIECDPRENPFSVHYIRSKDLAVGEPVMMYDVGRTFVATQGQLADGNILGDLWVTYEVELKKPQLRSAATTTDMQFDAYNSSTTSMFVSQRSVSGPRYMTFDVNQIIVNPRQGDTFLVALNWWDANLSAASLGTAVLSNCSVTLGGNTITSGSANFCTILLVNVVDQTLPATINFSGNLFTGTMTKVSTYISRTN